MVARAEFPTGVGLDYAWQNNDLYIDDARLEVRVLYPIRKVYHADGEAIMVVVGWACRMDRWLIILPICRLHFPAAVLPDALFPRGFR